MQLVVRIRRRFAAVPTLVVDTGLALLLTGINLFMNRSAQPEPSQPTLNSLVRQPHLVMFKALSLVVASLRACLVGSSPVGPVIGVGVGVGGVGSARPEAADFVAGQGDQVCAVGGSAPFWSRRRSWWAVTARNAAASMDRVMCRYQGS